MTSYGIYGKYGEYVFFFNGIILASMVINYVDVYRIWSLIYSIWYLFMVMSADFTLFHI